MSGRREGLVRGADGRWRCKWAGDDPLYVAYHDREWGRPVCDEVRLFEKLCLEGFQAGLSWLTILRKRERFRAAFHNFDPAAVAKMGARDVTRLLADPGIVRHRGKIEAVINNARQAIEVAGREGSLAAFLWRHEPDPSRVAEPQTVSVSPEAIALSKALKKQGWKFVGPTTVYAFMQAMGLVNDHVAECAIRRDVEDARARFTPPTG